MPAVVAKASMNSPSAWPTGSSLLHPIPVDSAAHHPLPIRRQFFRACIRMPPLPYSLPPEKSTPEARFSSLPTHAEAITTYDASSKIHNSRQISALRAGAAHLTESLAESESSLTRPANCRIKTVNVLEHRTGK